MPGPLDTAENTDKVLLGGCAAVWLVALGTWVAATVALVNLGHGQAQSGESSDTPWFLYTIIAISVVVIAGAIPLLLRARAQAANPSSTVRPASPPMQAQRGTGSSYPITPVVVSGSSRTDNSVSGVKADQVWLRHILIVASALGAATAAIAIATYLMATGSDVAAWCVYGVAGVVAAGMVALPFVAFRQLDALSA